MTIQKAGIYLFVSTCLVTGGASCAFAQAAGTNTGGSRGTSTPSTIMPGQNDPDDPKVRNRGTDDTTGSTKRMNDAKGMNRDCPPGQSRNSPNANPPGQRSRC